LGVIYSASNLGVASAINQAAAHARGNGYKQLLVLDQDSLLADDMVVHLQHALSAPGAGTGRPVAAVGPVFVDRRTGEVAPFVRIGPLLNRKLAVAPGEQVECDFLISSGTLVPLSVLERVGGMDESLFIDNVDLEWSFRARHQGYRLLGVGNARMVHAIGDRVYPVTLFGRRLSFSLHGPVRLYYMTRNRLLLYVRPQTPWAWISQDIPRVVLKLAGMSLFVAPRWQNLRAMLHGMADALRGRGGPYRR
ncbi:MAG: glycosyltransferase family 2 protein, partial [Stenotrophomonas koreensis]